MGFVRAVVWFLSFVIWDEYGTLAADCTPQTALFLQGKSFWKTYTDEVLYKKTWKSTFPEDVLITDIEKDAAMYKDPTIFMNRRTMAQKWLKNDTIWSELVYGASKELAHGVIGPFSETFQHHKMLDALRDYILHIHFFQEVADIMQARNETVVIHSQRSSVIHDIDKLDPVMVVGYSERFEDNKTTSLWEKCVYRHTHINPHHQSHCIWQDCCQIQNKTKCLVEGDISLNEMVCDKVSRKLQKNLNGKISKEMWEVDAMYFNGLPDPWLRKAEALILKMKNWE